MPSQRESGWYIPRSWISPGSEDWRRSHPQGGHALRVLWNDQEVFQLSHIDETWHQDFRQSANSVFEDEMRCQHDMRVRGMRLRAYHQKLGDLFDILGIAA
jgi:hypothetical protein